MTWRWEPDRKPSTWVDKTFPTQGEAETWLGEFYPELSAAGVSCVTLYELDRRVYGPMSLEAG